MFVTMRDFRLVEVLIFVGFVVFLFFVFFFFFQAEDGIRDGTVTGVQTCALPICARGPQARRACRHGRQLFPAGGGGTQPLRRLRRPLLTLPLGYRFRLWSWDRSEERRVGKECRSRWST